MKEMLKQSSEYEPLRDSLPILCKRENGMITGKTLLFTKGKRKFAHGADIMLPVSKLIHEITDSEKGIATVESLRFLSVTTHELEIFGATDQELLPSGYVRPALLMNCKTGSGTDIYIAAYPTEEPITHHLDSGIILEEIDDSLKIIEKTDNNNRILIEIAAFNTDHLNFRNSHICLHIAIEILSVAVLRLKKQGILPGSKLLLSGIDNLIPPKRDEISDGITLRFDICRDRDKVIRSGAVITPVEVSYCKPERIQPYGVAYLVHSSTGQFEHLERQD